MPFPVLSWGDIVSMMFLSKALARCHLENGTMTPLWFCERTGMYAQGAQVTELLGCIRRAFNASCATRERKRRQGWDRMGLVGMANHSPTYILKQKMEVGASFNFLQRTYISV